MDDKIIRDTNLRTKYAYIEAWIGIIGNLIIFIIKIVFGLIINSVSLIADSFHTLTDVLTSSVVLVGFKISRKPADKEHPFGHGRMEDVATLIIAVLLAIVGIELIRNSFGRILKPQIVLGNFIVVGMLIFTGIAKEWMARFSFKLGKKIDSQALVADAWHHRSDAITNILVLIAIIASRFGYYKVDSILGIVVSLIIIFVAIKLIRSSVSYLLGKAPRKDLIKQIRRTVFSIPDVKGAHDILVHTYGNDKLISLHIEVDKNLDVQQAHKVASSVENKIWHTIRASAVVHIDLKKRRSRSAVNKKDPILNKIISSFPEIASYHGLDFMSTEAGDSLDFHIVVRPDMSVEQSHNLVHKLTGLIKEQLKDYSINIHIEPYSDKDIGCSEDCDVEPK